MLHVGDTTTVTVYGRQVILSFAETENPVALGKVKQILLSSFAAHATEPKCKGILAFPSRQRDNIGEGENPMHLENSINAAQ